MDERQHTPEPGHIMGSAARPKHSFNRAQLSSLLRQYADCVIDEHEKQNKIDFPLACIRTRKVEGAISALLKPDHPVDLDTLLNDFARIELAVVGIGITHIASEPIDVRGTFDGINALISQQEATITALVGAIELALEYDQLVDCFIGNAHVREAFTAALALVPPAAGQEK